MLRACLDENGVWGRSNTCVCMTEFLCYPPETITTLLTRIRRCGLPCWLSCKESTCNAGDPGSIPRLGSSPGEGIVYQLQYSWTSLVVQTVKNPPAMWENWVQSLGWEDPLEEGMVTHHSIFTWRIPTDREAWQQYWSGLPCPPPGDLPNPGIEPRFLHCRWILYQLSHEGSPRILE